LVNRPITITFLLVFLTQPKHTGPLRYDNRNFLNKEVTLKYDAGFYSPGRPKVIIMVPFWKYVSLTSILSNFPNVHYVHTYFKLYTIVLLIQQHLLTEELTVTVPTGTKSGHTLSFLHGLQSVPYKMVLILIIGTGISDLVIRVTLRQDYRNVYGSKNI